MRRYGIDTTEAAVQAKALEMGLGDANGELTEQEKNLARSAILLDESNTFMGDFGRTSDSLANQQKQLAAKFSDVQVELGQKLLPVALAVAEVALDLIDGFSKVIEVFGEEGLSGVLDMIGDKFEAFATIRAIVEEVVGYIIGQVEALITIFDGIIDFIRAVFTGDWDAAWDAIKQIFSGVWDGIVGVVEGAWTLVKAAVNVIIDGVKLLWDWSFLSDVAETAINAVVGFVVDLPGRITDALSSVGSTLFSPIVNAFNAIVDPLLDAWYALPWNSRSEQKFASPGLKDPLKGVPIGPFVPGLAAGGIVTSPTLALIGESGPEAVVPLSGRNRFGGPDMVHVTLEVDGRVLAEVVADANRYAGGAVA